MCVWNDRCRTIHARSGKWCLQVVRSSWAEEKPPKTTIGSVQRGYRYVYTYYYYYSRVYYTDICIYIYIIMYKVLVYRVQVMCIIIIYIYRIIHYCRARPVCVCYFRVRDRLEPIHSLFCVIIMFFLHSR